MTDRGGKQPRSVLSGRENRKIPRSESFTPYDMNPVWAFRIIDLGGPWCWSRMGEAEIFAVLDRLWHFESMTWKEIENQTGSHRVDSWRIGKEARDRLVEIRQDDAETLFSLRIDGPGVGDHGPPRLPHPLVGSPAPGLSGREETHVGR